jgi:exodeoxyribonuclease-5
MNLTAYIYHLGEFKNQSDQKSHKETIVMWSPQQELGLKSVGVWYHSLDRKQVFKVLGYAGTGKTTLAKHFASLINGEVLYASFTGKAALVLRKAGCHGATTIHSLIYKPVKNEFGVLEFSINRNSSLKDAALLIVDECSMVDDELGKDLLSFGIPILVLGDPAQLPPPGGTGFFTEGEGDVMLTEIHRQAEDSPIIHLATSVRNGVIPKLGEYGTSKIVNDVSADEFMQYDQMIAGRNITRSSLNAMHREALGRESVFPVTGDRLICLKNKPKMGLFNGGMFEVLKTTKTKSKMFKQYTIKNLDTPTQAAFQVKVHDSFFTGTEKPNWKTLTGSQEFDFGFCITAHKSQGSQWDSVLVFDESYCFRDDKFRWLYTAITRASERVTIYR